MPSHIAKAARYGSVAATGAAARAFAGSEFRGEKRDVISSGRKNLHPVPRRDPAARPDDGRGICSAQAPDWALADDATRIERTYRFRNFAGSFAFVERAATLAEHESHHPDISFGWGYATVSLRTKKIKGLHENDFIMAAKLDRIAAETPAG